MARSRYSLRVAAAQVESHLGDVETNLTDHLAMIDEARSQGVEVLLFPEMSLTGHSAGSRTTNVALHRGDEPIRRLAEAAGSMYTVFGFIEEARSAQFYNSAAVVRDGKLVFVHRKVALATYGRLDDGKHFGAGRRVDLVDIAPDGSALGDSPWHAGVLICNDLWNPALVHLAVLHGATLLLAPISSALEAVGAEFDNPGGWAVNLQFHAMTYGMPVVMANRCGPEADLNFWGGSRILDPFGHVLAQALEAKPQLVTADLDYARVRQARYLLPTARDGNLDLLLRESRRLAEILEDNESYGSQR